MVRATATLDVLGVDTDFRAVLPGNLVATLLGLAGLAVTFAPAKADDLSRFCLRALATVLDVALGLALVANFVANLLADDEAVLDLVVARLLAFADALGGLATLTAATGFDSRSKAVCNMVGNGLGGVVCIDVCGVAGGSTVVTAGVLSGSDEDEADGSVGTGSLWLATTGRVGVASG